MQRYLYSEIVRDLRKKMVFLTGPRQVGKTYLAKSIQPEFKKSVYLNNDDISDAAIINRKAWMPGTNLVILDEIHKKKGWKRFLKGAFDTRDPEQTFLVTGSARLDTYRQSGDSLAGRYYQYRLNPLSVKELDGTMPRFEALAALMELGGFPEPFLSSSADEANRWRRQYFTDIIREDILEFSRIHEIRAMRTLVEMLRLRVGSPLSYVSLAQDLQVAPNTVKKYVDILESLHVIFLIRPFHRNIARSLRKEPKAYFYDSGYGGRDDGTRLENAVAVCLRKHVQYLQDARGMEIELAYIRTKEGKEIDFAIIENQTIRTAIEVKISDTAPDRSLVYFSRKIPDLNAVQLVHNLRNEHLSDTIRIAPAAEWLATLAA